MIWTGLDLLVTEDTLDLERVQAAFAKIEFGNVCVFGKGGRQCVDRDGVSAIGVKHEVDSAKVRKN